MSERYIREKAALAMECLALSSANLPLRLANAWLSALDRLRRVDMSELEPEVVDSYQRVLQRLGTRASEGALPGAQLAAEDMSVDEALETARDIAAFHAGVMPLW